MGVWFYLSKLPPNNGIPFLRFFWDHVYFSFFVALFLILVQYSSMFYLNSSMHLLLCAHSYLLSFADWWAWASDLQYCNNCAWRRSYVFSFYDVWAQFMYQSHLRNCCRVNNEILILVVYLSFVRWDYYSTMVFNACLKGNLHICDT